MSERLPGGAGAADAVPAPPSFTASGVVPAAARAEVDRIRRRWAELAVATAGTAVPALRSLIETIAGRSAPEAVVPDLGPGVLPDQLAVVVWDAYAAGRGEGIVDLLTAVRRALP